MTIFEIVEPDGVDRGTPAGLKKSTRTVCANTAVFTQTVRVDFFSPAGAALSVPSGSTASNIVIAPGGVVTLRL